MIALSEIVQAKKIISNVVNKTPFALAPLLSEKFDTNIYLKKENLQLTGAYKIRGAYNKISSLTDDAGLELIKYIRGILENQDVRIVIRTGQPGAAPEEEVVKKYDINDYKEKTELTDKKFFTTVYSALKSYRDIRNLKKLQQEKMLNYEQTLYSLVDLIEKRDTALSPLQSTKQYRNDPLSRRGVFFQKGQICYI